MLNRTLVVATIGFFANRHFTFQYDGQIINSGLRYLIAQLLGYLSNLLMLVLFVDWLGFAHQVVQAWAIMVVAILLFTLLKFLSFQLIQKNWGD